MPVSTLVPSDANSVPFSQWNLYAGSDKVSAVQSDDGGATSINNGVGDHRQCYNVPWPAGIGLVHSLTAGGSLAMHAGGAWSAGVGCRNASGEDVQFWAMTNDVYYPFSHACSRPGGGAWSPADCAAGVTWVEVLNYFTPGVGSTFCSYLYFSLDYDPAGGFVSLIFGERALSVLLPVVGALAGLSRRGAELLLEAVNREMFRRTRTRFRPDELAMVLEAVRSQRRPRFAFLGQPAML